MYSSKKAGEKGNENLQKEKTEICIQHQQKSFTLSAWHSAKAHPAIYNPSNSKAIKMITHTANYT